MATTILTNNYQTMTTNSFIRCAITQFCFGYRGKIRTYDTQNQNLLPYHLATRQYQESNNKYYSLIWSSCMGHIIKRCARSKPIGLPTATICVVNLVFG